MSGTSKGSEEYYRSMMVKLAREAGTMIRKEEVKRQALTAEVNLNYAESLRKLLEQYRREHVEPHPLLEKPTILVGKFQAGDQVNIVPPKCTTRKGGEEIILSFSSSFNKNINPRFICNIKNSYTCDEKPLNIRNLLINALSRFVKLISKYRC